jgi:hypothetical protein
MGLQPSGVNLKIDGVSIKEPHFWNVEDYNLTKNGRVANGKMTMELVAQKRKFNVKYDVISGPDLDLIASKISGTKMFFLVEYLDNGVQKSATCYSGAIHKDKFRTDGKWYWKNVEFALIEQ